jgi:superfamily II RNA helicase
LHLLLLLLLLPGLVEAWAGGASWQEIMQDTSIDDGDMARLLARTADMLKQVRASNMQKQQHGSKQRQAFIVL